MMTELHAEIKNSGIIIKCDLLPDPSRTLSNVLLLSVRGHPKTTAMRQTESGARTAFVFLLLQFLRSFCHFTELVCIYIYIPALML
jgi:hypothetical protein